MTQPFEPRDEDRSLLIGAGRFADDEPGSGEARGATIDMPATPERVWRAINRPQAPDC